MSADSLGDAVRRLTSAGIESARLDSRLLWDFARDLQASALVGGGDDRTQEIFSRLIDRRAAREPLAYIVGRKEFWSLDFAVGPGALTPRPESETLIEQVRAQFPNRQEAHSVLDLGTGTGCLLIAVLTEYSAARGVGIDASPDAMRWARANVASHALTDRASLIEGSWLEETSSAFDIVLCNPPYIRSADIDTLEPEVRRYEPRAALDGGPDGLSAYRALAPRIGRLLSPSGRAFVEIGAGQDTLALRIFEAAQLTVVAVIPDLMKIPRCIVLKRDNPGG